MAASQQQTLHAELFAGTHLGDGVIKATKEDNSTRVRKKPFIDVNRNISITKDNYPNSQGTDQYEPKLCGDISDGSKLEEHQTEDSSDSNKVQDSNLQTRLQSTMRSLPDFSQLSLEDRASQVPLRASTPSPHATSSGLVFSEVQPNPRLPSPFVGCSRSKSDHDISDITEYGPKPTRSNSDHVPALPSLTRTECRRHTLPSLLPTITIWEAEGPGPDTGSSASDLSKADPNFLLPVEVRTNRFVHILINNSTTTTINKTVSQSCAERRSAAPERGLACLAGHTLLGGKCGRSE